MREKSAAFEKKLDAETRSEFENLKKKLPKDSKAAAALQEQFEKAMEEQEEEECPPELEEVDLEQLNRTKEQKNKEWLASVVDEESKETGAPPLIKKEDLKIEEVETLTRPAAKAKTPEEEEDEMVKLEEILMDEKKVEAAQKLVTEKDIKEFVEAQCNAV